MAPYGASEVVQSTVRSSEATLKEILKVFLKVFLQVQPSQAQTIRVFEELRRAKLSQSVFLKAQLSKAWYLLCLAWCLQAQSSLLFKSLWF